MDLVRRIESRNKCIELSQHPNLPPEIINEILLRLPVRSLLKFKCVCKSWLISISSSKFIKTHLDISAKSNNCSNYAVILASLQFPPTLYNCPLSSILNNTVMDDTRDFGFPMSVLDYDLRFVGCCNGLVCLYIRPKMLVFYNPSIRKLKTLPVSGTRSMSSSITYGFCYDEIGGDFKVVQLNIVNTQAYVYSTEVKVYSLRNDTWRKIENNHDGLVLDGTQPVGGILHWCSSFKDEAFLIFAVNTVTNKYDTMELPKYDVKKGPLVTFSLGELNGSLATFCSYYKTQLDVWEMKEYGVNESWSMVVSVAYPANPSGYHFPLLVLENAEFCLDYGPYMMLYNSKDNSFTTHQINSTGGLCKVMASPYIDSLVDPRILGE